MNSRRSFSSAALLFTIAAGAKSPAQATFKHTGTTGVWYIQFQRDVVGSGPSTTVYSRKLTAGEEFTKDDPPKGEVWALAGGTPDADLSYYAGWAT
jgi:hypothetical protein